MNKIQTMLIKVRRGPNRVTENSDNTNKIVLIKEIEKVMLNGLILSMTFQQYCDNNVMRRGQRKQIFAIVVSVIVVSYYSYPLFAEWPTIHSQYIGDPLIVIGTHERIMVYLIITLVGVMMIFARLIFIIGELIK